MEANKLYIGRAEEVLKTFPDDCIDLTVTSPPYDNLRDDRLSFEDFMVMAKELYRVTKPGGYVVWVVADQTDKGTESLTSLKQALYFKENCGFKVHDTMIYQTSGFSNPSNNRYHQVWEYMFVFCKKKWKTFNPIKDRKNIYAGQQRWGKNAKRQKDGTMKVNPDTPPIDEFGMRFNVWKYAAGGNVSTSDPMAYKHSAIYPEKLAHDHIISWSNEGDIVLDPMVGSGTTAKMAYLAGRQYIGIDCSAKHMYDSVIPRLELHNIPYSLTKT